MASSSSTRQPPIVAEPSASTEPCLSTSSPSPTTSNPTINGNIISEETIPQLVAAATDLHIHRFGAPTSSLVRGDYTLNEDNRTIKPITSYGTRQPLGASIFYPLGEKHYYATMTKKDKDSPCFQIDGGVILQQTDIALYYTGVLEYELTNRPPPLREFIQVAHFLIVPVNDNFTVDSLSRRIRRLPWLICDIKAGAEPPELKDYYSDDLNGVKDYLVVMLYVLLTTIHMETDDMEVAFYVNIIRTAIVLKKAISVSTIISHPVLSSLLYQVLILYSPYGEDYEKLIEYRDHWLMKLEKANPSRTWQDVLYEKRKLTVEEPISINTRDGTVLLVRYGKYVPGLSEVLHPLGPLWQAIPPDPYVLNKREGPQIPFSSESWLPYHSSRVVVLPHELDYDEELQNKLIPSPHVYDCKLELFRKRIEYGMSKEDIYTDLRKAVSQAEHHLDLLAKSTAHVQIIRLTDEIVRGKLELQQSRSTTCIGFDDGTFIRVEP